MYQHNTRNRKPNVRSTRNFFSKPRISYLITVWRVFDLRLWMNYSIFRRLLYLLSLHCVTNCYQIAIELPVNTPKDRMSSENSVDLEFLYSPSRWCKRYNSSDECLQDHVRIITEESDIVRSSIPANLDVPYGSLQKQKYDLFGIDLPDATPIIFYVHGGYWQEECIGRRNSSFIAKIFHNHGIKSFVIGYELCPNVQLKEIMQQVEEALKVCLDYAKRKGSRGICLMGHSAGAHLVTQLFVTFVKTLLPEDLCLLRSAFLIGGLYDLEPLLSTSYNVPLKLTAATAKEYSPINHKIAECDTKFFVVVGENDSPAFVKQSEIIERGLKDQNITTSLMILDNIDHFNIIEKLTEEDYVLVQLVLKTLL